MHTLDKDKHISALTDHKKKTSRKQSETIKGRLPGSAPLPPVIAHTRIRVRMLGMYRIFLYCQASGILGTFHCGGLSLQYNGQSRWVQFVWTRIPIHFLIFSRLRKVPIFTAQSIVTRQALTTMCLCLTPPRSTLIRTVSIT